MKVWSVRTLVRFLSIVVAVISLVLLPRLVNADALSWTSTNPVVESKSSVGTGSGWKDACQERYKSIAQVVDVQGDGSPGSYKTDCVVGDGANYTLYSYSSFRRLAIKFDGDIAAHTIYGVVCQSSCIYMPSRDTLVVVDHINYFGAGEIDMYKNFVSKLKLNDSLEVYNRSYTYDQSPDQIVSSPNSDSPGYLGQVKSVQRSQNDKWLVVEFVGIGLVRIDMDNLQMLKFSDWGTGYSYGNQPIIKFDITNDGQHVAVFGQSTINRIFDITDTCGNLLLDSATYADLAKQQVTPCPWVIAANGPAVGNDVIDNPSDMFQPQFSGDGGEISFVATSYDTSISPLRVTMRAANYTGPPQLDYLALGDSYSSGEGDTEKDTNGNKYYRAFTDIGGDSTTPKERCHVSTRSYPYKLASGMNLLIDGPKRWDTVTCSGATTWDVRGRGSANYTGQWDRLKGFDVESLKTQALNEFIPGRQKQVEFVKKYRPKVITLTMGGNDVGFADKLQECVRSFGTCDIVNERRNTLSSEILNQYDNLKKLYEELYSASGSQAKIYVLGYPDFISGDVGASCALNVGLLNSEERELIANSITYLNNVIKQAAKAAGVKYIDIENSLSGHRLCDDSEKYVTGITDPLDWSNNRQESFHPNAKGHQAIAQDVWSNANGVGENLIDYDICPGSSENRCPDMGATKETINAPEYFANSDSSKNIEYKRMTQPEQKKSSLMQIILGTFTFAPGSFVNLVIHSDPVDLGQYIVTNDGSVNIDVIVPSEIPAGYHTVILTGQTYTGDSVEYEQTILVDGSDTNDIDEDGIIDTQDACLFIPASGTDYDQDGIDDACDSVIGEPPITLSPTPTPTPSQLPNPTSSIIHSPATVQAPKHGRYHIVHILFNLFHAIVQIISAIIHFLLHLLGAKFK